MNNTLVIKTSGVSYQYSREGKTISDINLEVEKGSIYGFLGPNGSGKTTTLSLILGLMEKQEGTIEIFGQHLDANRIGILKKIGSSIETPSVYNHLTARENLEIYRMVYGATPEKLEEVLKIVGLDQTGKKVVKKFSLGMKQRLSIALALLPDPELLILDEPTNGLDPAGIIELRELIKKLNRTYGISILISSHMLSEVEKMVTHLGIILKGKMIFQGTMQELHEFQQKGSRVFIDTSDNQRAMELLRDYDVLSENDNLSVSYQDKKQVASIQKMLNENNLEIYLLYPKKNDLEQLFIDLTSAQS